MIRKPECPVCKRVFDKPEFLQQHIASKNNAAHIKWRISMEKHIQIDKEKRTHEQNKRKSEQPKNETKGDFPPIEGSLRCSLCSNWFTDDIFSHMFKYHKDFLENHCIKPITEPLSSFIKGYRESNRGRSYIVNFVYTCDRCKIKVGSEYCNYGNYINCPICGNKLYSKIQGEGKIEFRPRGQTWAQRNASKENLAKAREARSKESERNRIIHIKHIPPMMKKIHLK